MSRRRILFVDDNLQFLTSLREVMLHWSEDTWEVLLAEGAGPALALLQQQPVDLVVVDLEMPVVDGLQLLKLLHRKYPSIPRAALTGEVTEAKRAACLGSGAELCLEKPTTGEGLKQLYNALNGLARPAAEEGFRGVLRRVGLSDVIQMECLAANSSVLEVSGGDVGGEIYIRSGAIIHAWTGNLRGEEAFYRLLALRGGQFALHPFVAPATRTIEGAWEFLVMEAARKVDEAREAAAPGDEAPEAAPTVTAKPKGEMPAPSMTSYLPQQEQPAAAPAPPASRIEEVLLCSSQGEVLYEWQCADTEARISLLEFLSQKSWQIENSLPVGRFNRVEAQGPDARLVSQLQNDRGLFVRTTQTPANGA